MERGTGESFLNCPRAPHRLTQSFWAIFIGAEAKIKMADCVYRITVILSP